MKTRMSFVSNSSTTSYVIAGCKLFRNQPESSYWFDAQCLFDEFHNQLNDITIIHLDSEDAVIVGTKIFAGDFEDIAGCIETDIKDLLAKAESIKENYNLTGPVKIYVGTEYC